MTHPIADLRRMGRLALAALVLTSAAALPASAQSLNETQQLGQRLYMTSCGLCHSHPDLANKAPAPMLSKATLKGNAEDIAMFIKTGTETMPSFKVNFTDAQINAIAQFITTLPEAESK